MARKKCTSEENARREKIRELLQMESIGSMDDIQSLFKETIAEFMENGLDAELDDELGCSKYGYKTKDTDNSRNGHSSKTLCRIFRSAPDCPSGVVENPAVRSAIGSGGARRRKRGQ